MTEDLHLRQDVERELGWESIVRSAEIGVGVKDGIVTLSGVVDSHAVKRAAERAAARVLGVKAVSSQLEVDQGGLKGRTDADIAWSAANALAWNALIPADRIQIEVSHGWVTLEGFVDWRFQGMAAEEVVAELAGVEGVTNMIAVCPAVPPAAVKREVETALNESSKALGRRVVVETRCDCVTLWGSVGSQKQREAAEDAAWSAAGVREVSNHITISAGVAASS
jgi:osmotically-inducible protein OsmY